MHTWSIYREGSTRKFRAKTRFRWRSIRGPSSMIALQTQLNALRGKKKQPNRPATAATDLLQMSSRYSETVTTLVPSPKVAPNFIIIWPIVFRILGCPPPPRTTLAFKDHSTLSIQLVLIPHSRGKERIREGSYCIFDVWPGVTSYSIKITTRCQRTRRQTVRCLPQNTFIQMRIPVKRILLIESSQGLRSHS